MSEVKYKAVEALIEGTCEGCVAQLDIMLCESFGTCCPDNIIYKVDSIITLEQAREKFEEWYLKEFPKNCHKDTFQRSKTGNSYAYKMPAESFEAYQQALKDFDILEEGE